MSLLHPLEKKFQREDTRRRNNQVYDEVYRVEEHSGSSVDSSASSGEVRH